VPVNSDVRTHVAVPANYIQVLAHFRKMPEDIRAYFPTFEELVQKYSWDVSIAYVFSRIERLKHETIYCGIVKRHRTDATLTRDLVDKDHMSRSRFRELFKVVFGLAIDKPLLEKLGGRGCPGQGNSREEVERRTGKGLLSSPSWTSLLDSMSSSTRPPSSSRLVISVDSRVAKSHSQQKLLGGFCEAWAFQGGGKVSPNMSFNTDAELASVSWTPAVPRSSPTVGSASLATGA
jgi:hypothetical protein